MSQNAHSTGSKPLDQISHIAAQRTAGIGRQIVRAAGLAIAALIRCDAVKVIAEIWGQIAPRAAIFGKTVQHQQNWCLRIPPMAGKYGAVLRVVPACLHPLTLVRLGKEGKAGKASR